MRVCRFVFVTLLMVVAVAGVSATAFAQAKTAFATPTTGSTFVVPAGVTTVTVKAWGAGGGYDFNGGLPGGGGGFAKADIAVTPGETLTVRVGGGGVADQISNVGAGGGGYSGVFRGSTPLLIAGGGGGGASFTAGGPGGGLVGSDAAPSGYGAGGGFGGTQSAGGVHGANDAGYAQNGSYLQGGQGGWVEPNQGNGYSGGLNGGGTGGKIPVGGRRSAGGGGGGYYGGGGGSSANSDYADSTGGGGGSSYVTGTQTTTIAGSSYSAGNNGDADYVSGVGIGGGSVAGGPGRVVVIYTVVPQLLENDSTGAVVGAGIYHVSGNYGIGTQTPAFRLDVAGSFNASSLCIAADCRTSWAQLGSPWSLSGANTFFSAGGVGVGTSSPGYRLDVQGGQINASGGLCIAGDCKTSWPQAGGSPWNLSGTALSYSAGNVGVGTASPSYRLDVQGGQLNASGGLCIAGDCKTAWPASGQWTTSGTTLSYSAGKVGIGTSTPDAGLEVRRDDGIVTTGAAIWNTNASWNAEALFAAQVDINRLASTKFGTIQSNNGSGPSFIVKTGTTGSEAERFRITSSGNVGIGTSTPQAKLHVAGDILVDGNINAKYQDVAEWVEAAQPIAAGTVVIADPNRNNGVRASGAAYDTTVAGVVSVQPGLLLGEQSDTKVAVAQSGRVTVKVDASYGAIARGDLLVTSPREGYAMKSQPVMLGETPIHRPGTILGKALEPLASGEGEILVLLTLQ